MTKYLIAALIAALLGLGWYADHTRSALQRSEFANSELSDALERSQRAERKARKVLVARQAANASQARKLAQAQEALSEALQRNKPWSDTDVPPDVQDALRGAPDGLPDGLRRDDQVRP